MRVDWYGQAAFRLSGQDGTVFIDPFGDISPMAGRGIQFDYPPIEGVDADLLLVTHEHLDHNGVEAVGGDPTILRSTAGRLESPFGEVVAIASEHDEAAGTERGPNTIFVFTLDGVRVAHFGDFGQRSLRDEQADAIGQVDLLFLPVGGGPTIGAEQAAAIAQRLGPKLGRADALPHSPDRVPRAGRRIPREDAARERLSEPASTRTSLAGDDRPARGGSRGPVALNVRGRGRGRARAVRQRFASDALQVAQIVQMRRPSRIGVQVARHPHGVDVRVEQLV